MPWEVQTEMELKRKFVKQAQEPGSNMSELCRAHGISRKTGYKWLQRFEENGEQGLADRSRRPRASPGQTPLAMEQWVIAARDHHPTWGGRKLKRWLEDMGLRDVPAASTITAILRRHERLNPAESAKHKAYQRFAKEKPNELWQMDFKGHFDLANGQTCYPLTVLDDHSRFLLLLQACANQQHDTVQGHLTTLFRAYGLPDRMLMDNGSPWGDMSGSRHTRLTVWLMRLGVQVSHGRPYHPQTQGKEERLHRTFKYDLLVHHTLSDFPDAQDHFDPWRHDYNWDRPHEALGQDTPSTRYQPSSRPFPEVLPPVSLMPTDEIRKVDSSGKISFRNRPWHISKAFIGQRVGLRPDPQVDGLWQVHFSTCHITTLDLRNSLC